MSIKMEIIESLRHDLTILVCGNSLKNRVKGEGCFFRAKNKGLMYLRTNSFLDNIDGVIKNSVSIKDLNTNIERYKVDLIDALVNDYKEDRQIKDLLNGKD
jgi:hypothetical protein